MGYYKNTLRYRKTSHSITITKYKSCDGCTEVEIPAVIEGLPVTKIDGWVFSECSLLTKVIIPPSVTEIGPSAFYGCHGLADEQGFVIVGGVLYDYIGDGGIVAVPEGVYEIGVSAFYQCYSLSRVILPESLRVIRGQAFFECENLKSINIPDGVERIVFWAFKNCYGLADADGLVIVGGILFNY
ncbi:MAG: leucine-rich repeat domain-containing protein, partial [Eubacteriales bacterium]